MSVTACWCGYIVCIFVARKRLHWFVSLMRSHMKWWKWLAKDFFGNGVGGNVLQYILAHSGYDCVIYISISITTDGYMFVVSPSRIHSLNCRLVENFPQISYSTYADRFHCCHHVPPPPPPTYSLHTRARNTVQLIVRSRHFFATYKSRKDII